LSSVCHATDASPPPNFGGGFSGECDWVFSFVGAWQSVIAGKPRSHKGLMPITQPCFDPKSTVGAWLARDGIDTGWLMHSGGGIASKLAPAECDCGGMPGIAGGGRL
ncbi:hypothetical protein, partial [Pseudomonas sp. Ant30-3]|uniref:hypothetical protein n=1 Tax=Pseudomonas sp. Ant30-3 TaxID=1488328 RepID=UPI001F2D260D